MASAAGKTRFDFVTQLPRDDGCGVCVLQMLTGKPYEQLAGMIDWGGQTNHYMTWDRMRGALTELGWRIGGVTRAEGWDDVRGLAVVNVEGDHFILYDGGAGAFYDPGHPDGPEPWTRLAPLTYMQVQAPANEA